VTITTTDVTEKNFTARTQTYSIYGTVTELGGSPVAGAALSLFKNSLHIQSTISNSSGQYSFGGLSNGTYTITIDSGCVPVLQDMSATIDCASVERNFVCEAGLGESKRQEAAARLNRLKTFDGIDNKGRQADNGDMETQPDKDNPSAFSLQPSARTEASVAEYLFYHSDHLGTVRLITNASGAVVSRHDYEPFGVEIAPVVETANNTHRFTGHERDKATGYDYMHYRSYGSNLGRFMKPDNISGNPLNPQSWNLYSYVRGNPVNFNDPTGHEAKKTDKKPSDASDSWSKEAKIKKLQEKLDFVEKVAKGEIKQVGSVKFDPSFQKALAGNEKMKQGFAGWLATGAGGRMFDKFTKDENTTFTFKGEMGPSGDNPGETIYTSNDMPVHPEDSVDCKAIEMYINPDTKGWSADLIAGIIIEESLHAESMSVGYSRAQYWNIRGALDDNTRNKPNRYQRIQNEAAEILKLAE
jgi:RHS repeat-associated protein